MTSRRCPILNHILEMKISSSILIVGRSSHTYLNIYVCKYMCVNIYVTCLFFEERIVGELEDKICPDEVENKQDGEEGVEDVVGGEHVDHLWGLNSRAEHVKILSCFDTETNIRMHIQIELTHYYFHKNILYQ